MGTKRVNYFDTMKTFAIVIVIVTHFISIACPSVFALWHSNVGGFFLRGISGKLGVSIFCVILGYLASNSKKNLVSYISLRYMQFVIPPLFVYLAILIEFVFGKMAGYIFTRPGIFDSFQNLGGFGILKRIVGDTLFLKANILPTFWCLSIFMAASILIAVVSRVFMEKSSLLEFIVGISIFILLLFSGAIWLSICWMGYIVRIIQKMELKILNYQAISVVIFLVSILLYRRPSESELTYLLQGTAVALFIIAVTNLKFIATVLSYKPLVFLGQNSLYMYIWHIPVIVFGYEVVNWFSLSLASPVVVVLYFVITFTVVTLLAKISGSLYSRFENMLRKKLAL